MRKEISRLEYLGYIVLMHDEAIFMADTPARRCVFSKIGARSTHVVSGTRQKQIVYGAIAINGKQIFCQYKKFDTVTFVKFPKETVRKFGKTVTVADRAPQHRAKVVTKFLNKNRHRTKSIFLPHGSPYVNPVEGGWRQSMSYCSQTVCVAAKDDDKKHNRYCKIKQFSLNIMSYLLRAPPQTKWIVYTGAQYVRRGCASLWFLGIIHGIMRAVWLCVSACRRLCPFGTNSNNCLDFGSHHIM